MSNIEWRNVPLTLASIYAQDENLKTWFDRDNHNKKAIIKVYAQCCESINLALNAYILTGKLLHNEPDSKISKAITEDITNLRKYSLQIFTFVGIAHMMEIARDPKNEGIFNDIIIPLRIVTYGLRYFFKV